MKIKSLIEKKQRQELTYEDFEEFSKYLISSKISEKNVVEFVKILKENNCTDKELCDFSIALAKTGIMLDATKHFGFCVDKQSAGLFSDAMTIVLMSVLPCFGIKFVKTISDGYGDTGSLLERLRSIDGFDGTKNIENAVQNAKNCGVFLYEDCGKIAPAALKLYNICKRYNMFTEQIISSTIMANKIATGSDMLVADIKSGEGALIDNDTSENIAQRLVNIGKIANIKTVSVISDLNWPISASVGNKLELQEIKDMLSGSKDYAGSSLLVLAKEMVVCVLLASKQASTRSEAAEMFDLAISSGRAYAQFCKIINAYGGNLDSFDRTEKLIDTAVSYVVAKEDGYVCDIKLKMLYDSVKKLIGEHKSFDDCAGLVLMCKEGDKVLSGTKLAKVFYSHSNKRYFDVALALHQSFVVSKEKPVINNLFYKVVI